MKNLFLASILIISLIHNAQAMGSKRPSTTSSIPQTSIVIDKPTIDFGADLDQDEYLNAASIVGPSVDQFQKQFALSEVRTKINPDNADKCFNDEKSHDIFSEQISYYSALMIKGAPAMIGVIGSYYGTSENDNNYFPTSLIRHPLCAVTKSTLGKTLKNIPTQSTIDKLNNYSLKVNLLRKQVIAGDMKAKAELLSVWSRVFYA